jgi:hypothetical protein
MIKILTKFLRISDQKIAILASQQFCCIAVPDPNFSIPDLGSKRFRIPDPDPHKII